MKESTLVESRMRYLEDTVRLKERHIKELYDYVKQKDEVIETLQTELIRLRLRLENS